MYYSKPRRETVKKYTTYLKSLLIKIDKYGDMFSPAKFVEENRLPHKFLCICKELKYISSSKEGYHTIIKAEQVVEAHGLAIAEASLRYNINHSELYEKKGCCIVTQRGCKSKLSEFTVQQLFDELRIRGVVFYLE
jgi:hypothetical protein